MVIHHATGSTGIKEHTNFTSTSVWAEVTPFKRRFHPSLEQNFQTFYKTHKLWVCNPSRAVPPAAQVPPTPAAVGALLWLCQSRRPDEPQSICAVGSHTLGAPQPLGTSTLRWSLKEADSKPGAVWILVKATHSNLCKKLIRSMNLGDSQSFDDVLTRNKTTRMEAGSPAESGATGSVASSLGFSGSQIF